MADFVAVLKKTIDGMGATTPATRSRVYDKARATIAAKLAAIEPPPAASVAERQKRALEDAIETVEQTYAAPVPAPADPLAELENIFSSIDRNRNQPTHSSPTARTEPALKPQTPAAPVHGNAQPAPAAAGMRHDHAAQKGASAAETARDAADRRSGPDAPVAADTPSYSIAEPETDILQDSRSFGRKRGRRSLIAAVAALLVIAAGGYGIWLNADAFKGMFSAGKTETATLEPLAPAAPASETPAPTPADTGEPPKFTQRLNADGKETDPGPAGGESSIGEGTSVAALTTPPAAVAPTGAAGAPAAATAGDTTPAAVESPLAVGQKAIFYEERTNVAQGSAEPGSIVWSLVQESPGGDVPPEPVIRAEATIPGKDVQLRMTIRRNTDASLPASHIIELIFLTPEGFEGGGIDNILRVAMKTSEQDAGSPLIGIPAKIADGFFLVALNDTKADEATNLALLRNQDWIDVPVVYKSGRRALLTMEKGIPGDKVFDEALKAWADKTAG